MSLTEINKILEIYKKLAQNPTLTDANVTFTSENQVTVRTVWSQRNLERHKKQKFVQDFSFDSNLQLLVKSFPVDVSSEILTVADEYEELKAILKEVTIDGKSKQLIEIWDTQHFIKSYDLSAFDVHGEVYFDQTFSAFQWSPDNTRLLYIAEKKLPKCEPFYKQKPKSEPNKTDNGEPSKGTEYVYKPDWGEQLVGKHRSVVVILNIAEDTITALDSIPDEYFPSQVSWAPNGNDIVGIAYKINPRYLGLIFCTNRESYVFHLKEKEFRKLTSEGLSCKSPRFSPDGKYLVWLERKISPPHDHVQKLMYMKWNEAQTPNTLIDAVKTNLEIADGKKFYGVYSKSLPKRCWSDDSKYLFFSTLQRYNIKSYIINLETKIVSELNNPDNNSLTVFDVKKNLVVFKRSSLIQPSQLVIGKFNSASSDIGNCHLINGSKLLNVANDLKNVLMYQNTEYIYESDDAVKDFNFTYLGKRDGLDKSVPLIVIPHGGPHSSFTNEFSLSHVFLALVGFGVLQVNYRGSLGMGGDNVEYILGKIGESDILDCMTAMNVTLEKYPFLDPKNINLFGGSHGGFIVAQLSGQYPDMFRAVAMRNPVIDLALNFRISDIPDWCPAELNSLEFGMLPETISSANYSKSMQKMLEKSPILFADKVKAPTLIALGSKDLRVPQSQGKLWYYKLTSNNVKTKLYLYNDNHSLIKDEVEIDFIINVALWLLEHKSNKSEKAE